MSERAVTSPSLTTNSKSTIRDVVSYAVLTEKPASGAIQFITVQLRIGAQVALSLNGLPVSARLLWC
jgi:hypothetical protein